MLDSLCQGEGLAGAVGPNDEDWRQGNSEGCGDGQDGLFLLGIQTGIQLLVPLPEGRVRVGALCEEALDQLLMNLQLDVVLSGFEKQISPDKQVSALKTRDREKYSANLINLSGMEIM